MHVTCPRGAENGAETSEAERQSAAAASLSLLLVITRPLLREAFRVSPYSVRDGKTMEPTRKPPGSGSNSINAARPFSPCSSETSFLPCPRIPSTTFPHFAPCHDPRVLWDTFLPVWSLIRTASYQEREKERERSLVLSGSRDRTAFNSRSSHSFPFLFLRREKNWIRCTRAQWKFPIGICFEPVGRISTNFGNRWTSLTKDENFC